MAGYVDFDVRLVLKEDCMILSTFECENIHKIQEVQLEQKTLINVYDCKWMHISMYIFIYIYMYKYININIYVYVCVCVETLSRDAIRESIEFCMECWFH